MTIAVSCSHCKQRVKLDDHQAGKQARCPKCQKMFLVPKVEAPEEFVSELALEDSEGIVTPEAAGKRPAKAAAAVGGARSQRRPAPADSEGGGNGCIWIAVILVVGLLVLLVGGGLVAGVAFFLLMPKSEPTVAVVDTKKNDDDDKKKDDDKKEGTEKKSTDKKGDDPKTTEKKSKDKEDKSKEKPKQEKLHTAKLEKGFFKTQGQLDASDFLDPELKYLRKVYVAELQAGRKYTIDLVSKDFDSFLRLEDPRGKELARDDDSGGYPDARIVYTPLESGLFRVICTNLGGTGKFTLTIREEVVVVAEKVGEPSYKKDGLTITPLKLPGDKIVGDMLWTQEGDAFFTLTSDGVVSRIALHDFVLEKKATLAGRASFLALSSEGLLATMPDVQEVWLLDPVSLEVKKKIVAPSVQRAVSAASLKYAFAAGKDGVYVLDLVKGEAAGQPNNIPTLHARVTPDGKYYFAQGGTEQLCGYRIEGDKLVEHQKSERIAANGQNVCVSPDSMYVCLPSGGGNYHYGGTCVYAVDNLKKPEFTIPGGAMRLVGFDSAFRLVFGVRFEGKQLTAWTVTAIKLKEYDLTPNNTEQPQQFVAHPKGGKLLVQAGKSVVFVELEGLSAGGVDSRDVGKEMPTPSAPAQMLGQNKTQKNGLAITSINLIPDKIAGELLWTAEGDAFFALTKEGVLSRVAANGFVEEKRLNMIRRCSSLAMSGEGLLAMMIDLQEVWVIDPVSLEVKKRVSAPGAHRVVSAANLKVAFAVGLEGFFALDLVKGEAIPKPDVAYNLARVSADGKYYFGERENQLVSYKIEGTNLVEHQTSDRIANQSNSICVSGDGKYVCLCAGGGNINAKGGTHVFAVDNLKKAAFTIPPAASEIVGFDSATKVVLMPHTGRFIVAYSMTGAKLKEYNLHIAGAVTDNARQFAPHPKGKKLLVLTGKELVYVELEDLLVVKEEPKKEKDIRSIELSKSLKDGLTITTLNLAGDKIVGDMLWTAEGHGFFSLTSDGVLKRVALHGLIEEKKIELARGCTFLAMSAEGLLVTTAEPQVEVWVIDPVSLAIKKKIPAAGTQRAVSAPNLKVAFAANKDAVVVLDLVKGQAVKQWPVATQFARVTPDGKFYFARSKDDQLFGYTIKGSTLVPYQFTDRIAQNGQCICVSPDSKFVCLPSGGGNTGSNYATYVYGVGNLKKPDFVINAGAYPRVVGFDSAAGLVFAQNADKQLIVYTSTGIKLKEYELTDVPQDEPRQFVAHPKGKRLLVQLGRSVLLVELEGAATIAENPKDKFIDPKALTPTAPMQPIGQNKTKSNGLTITSMNLAADKIVGDVLWTKDGGAFFALTSDGVLSRVALKGFVEEKRLEMGRAGACLALSAEGLLATMPDLQEVWVIDPESLAVKKRIAAAGVLRAVSAPGLKVAIAAGKDSVAVLDLVKGEVVSQFKNIPSQFARVTPDGKYYFAQSKLEELCGYRIDGTSLVEYQKTARIAQKGQSICVSPDGKFICLPSADGNAGAGAYATFVYAIDNLKKAEFTLTTGAYPQTVAFDPAGELIYAQKSGKQLMVYTMRGAKVKEYSLAAERGVSDQPRQFVPHPKGKRLLVLAGKHLLFIELEIDGGARNGDGPAGPGVAVGKWGVPLLDLVRNELENPLMGQIGHEEQERVRGRLRL
jgi:DNA-binding beta-propeller fold protein YncE/DNA-directed RNA polymerase subunit RPC12/RpoP